MLTLLLRVILNSAFPVAKMPFSHRRKEKTKFKKRSAQAVLFTRLDTAATGGAFLRQAKEKNDGEIILRNNDW